MKKIILIRHAKSSWELDITDINRPLSPRGYDDANLLSKELLKYKIQPDAIFSSPAKRALTTCEIFMNNLNLSKNLLQIENELYDFEGRQVRHFTHNLSNDHNIVMIFGHNHAFTAIANSFGDKHIENVPTCGLVMIQFDEEYWKNIDKGQTKLTLFPKHI